MSATITNKQTEAVQSRAAYLPSQQDPKGVNVSGAERWLSGIAGGVLTFYGLRRLDIPGTIITALGVDLLYRGISGRSLAYRALGISTARHGTTRVPLPESTDIRVRRSLTINRSRDELYNYWHDVEKASTFMQEVETVKKTGKQTSHWVARIPSGKKIQWDAKFTEEQPGRYLEWRVQGKQFMVASVGRVSFVPASNGRGTIVTLELDYPRSNNFLRRNLNQVVSYLADKQALETVRSFKELMETGEIPTIKGQPTGQGRK